MILHIPHNSILIPQDTNFLSDIKTELERMTDWYTDELYTHDKARRIVLHVSRLVCDVERFEDDKQESMSKKGMGVCYTHNSFGEKFKEVSDKKKEDILNTYYRPHHQALSSAVDEELNQEKKALIVDCHSFPDEIHAYHTNTKRPDFCLGSDDFHTPSILLDSVKKFLEAKGYKVLINEPYSGTIVPMKHYGKTKEVHSIMIEVNRRLYCDNKGTKNSNFSKIQNILSELLELLYKIK